MDAAWLYSSSRLMVTFDTSICCSRICGRVFLDVSFFKANAFATGCSKLCGLRALYRTLEASAQVYYPARGTGLWRGCCACLWPSRYATCGLCEVVLVRQLIVPQIPGTDVH